MRPINIWLAKSQPSKKGLVSLTTVSLMLLMVVGCSRLFPPKDIVLHGSTMGTTYSVKVLALDSQQDEKQVRKTIDDILQQVDHVMSTYKKESELSKINSAPQNEWIAVSDDLFTVFNISRQVSEASSGWFDITVGPLVNLWGFGPHRGDHVPDEASIKEAKSRVGYHLLEMDEQNKKVRKQADLYIDLSAVAKGYAVDKVADYLLQAGMKNFLVEVGGEVRAHGLKNDQTPWRIAVEAPVVGERSAQKIIDVQSIAVATSGDYRNFFEENGQRYSHSIDPKTGRSISHGLASITVIHPSAAYADAYATALNVMGPERAKKLASKQQLPIFMIIRTDHGFEEYSNELFLPYLSK